MSSVSLLRPPRRVPRAELLGMEPAGVSELLLHQPIWAYRDGKQEYVFEGLPLKET